MVIVFTISLNRRTNMSESVKEKRNWKIRSSSVENVLRVRNWMRWSFRNLRNDAVSGIESGMLSSHKYARTVFPAMRSKKRGKREVETIPSFL